MTSGAHERAGDVGKIQEKPQKPGSAPHLHRVPFNLALEAASAELRGSQVSLTPPHCLFPPIFSDEAPLQKVSLARNSRYYLTCPMESRHATYLWRHEENVEQSCEPGHHLSHRPCLSIILCLHLAELCYSVLCPFCLRGRPEGSETIQWLPVSAVRQFV